MKHRRVLLLTVLFAIDARADPAAAPADGGASASVDWAQVDSAAREREAHLRQAQAFEARAKLEREMAARQTNPTVRAKLLEEANQLSAQAARERELISRIK